ncbi:MAG: hypothetical protein M3328_11165, partial [Chloroflexota bacterium]|nr:hypothetical protein [Chloroflexota bacterium]
MSERVSDRGKNVVDLREYQVAEQALDTLISTDPSNHDYEALLAETLLIGQPLLAAIVRRLDASHPQRLQALGRLISLYPQRSEAIRALLYAASERRNSDNRRLGATLLLEHFMGVPPADDFLSTLRDPTRVAVNSLTGILDDSADNPLLLHDYLRALLTQPGDLAFSVLTALQELGGDHTVEALRVLALQPDHELLVGALGTLESMAAQGSSAAVRALLVLEPNLPPDAARSVVRALQKLRLSGSPITPLLPPDVRCRALVSLIDGGGDRLLWLMTPAPLGGSDIVVVVGLVVNEVNGLLDAVGSPTVSASALPPHSPVGTLHPRFGESLPAPLADALSQYHLLTCLEVPFAYGLHLLKEAIQRNWSKATQLP